MESTVQCMGVLFSFELTYLLLELFTVAHFLCLDIAPANLLAEVLLSRRGWVSQHGADC
jgi:hypothetical protein